MFGGKNHPSVDTSAQTMGYTGTYTDNSAEAERLFLEVRDGFIRQGNGYDAAMASLGLALLYLKEGRTADVQRLAEEMVALFEARDVHRETLAALVLFQEAARREEVTAAMVRELAGRIQEVGAVR